MKNALVLVATAVLAAACGGSETSKMTVKMTDAASPTLKAAVVTITEIDLVGSGGTTVLSTAKVTTDLLTLANDTTTLLKDVEVPKGTYQELRFKISGGYVNEGGTIYASSTDYEGLPAGAQVAGQLKMPSLAQSGLKVDLDAAALDVQTDSKVMLVDFDVAQSFGHDAGNSGSWVLHPVIKGADIELSGNIDVSVKLAAGVTLPNSATVSAFGVTITNAAGSPKTLALTSRTDGTFGVTSQFLLPGAYTVSLALPAGVTSVTTTPALPATANVTGGATVTEAITITAAQ